MLERKPCHPATFFHRNPLNYKLNVAQTMYRFLFLFLVHHDNQVGLLFPDHLPEIVRCLVQRMLGCDVTCLAFVIL